MNTSSPKTDFYSILIHTALEHGFPLAGALDIDKADLSPHVERLDQWLENGNQGAMSYLERGRARRADIRLVFPEVKSILCVAVPYSSKPFPAEGARYARYLRNTDYHETMAERLERLMQEVASKMPRDLKWKVCVDTSAVLEKSWASLAGIGWIGKNTLLIHPQYGSYLFLGEILLSLPVHQGPKPLPNYCGNCTRCLDQCPTSAFTAPGTLDSRKCISYWTLEKRGELPIGEKNRQAMGKWVAGCDVCQEVCPFNTKAGKRDFSTGAPNSEEALESDWDKLLAEKPGDYRLRVKHSALNRVKPEQFSRNLAIALSNEIELSAGANSKMNPSLSSDYLNRVKARLESETDSAAKAEWERCLGLLVRSTETNSK
jgi:epoxyqueuosine reductase